MSRASVSSADIRISMPSESPAIQERKETALDVGRIRALPRAVPPPAAVATASQRPDFPTRSVLSTRCDRGPVALRRGRCADAPLDVSAGPTSDLRGGGALEDELDAA